MTEPEKYDYTTPAVVEKIAQSGQELDISLDQALDAIKQLAVELKKSRDRCNSLQEKHHKSMSDMEIRMAKVRGEAKRKLPDGVRYATPQTPQLGPDGFPQRGII